VRSAEHLRGIKQLRNKIQEEFAASLGEADKSIKAAKATKASIQQIVDKLIQPLDFARESIEYSRGMFERQQQEETLRLEKKAMEVAEAQRQAEEDALGAMGFEDTSVTPEPVHVPSPPALPKTAGVFASGRWGVKEEDILDIKALARAVADGVVPKEYIKANLTLLSTVASTARGTFNVPGVRAKFRKHTVVKA
jgi:hypothetical protein